MTPLEAVSNPERESAMKSETENEVLSRDNAFDQGSSSYTVEVNTKPISLYRVLADLENYKAWGGTGIQETKIIDYGREDMNPRQALTNLKCGAFGFSFTMKVISKFYSQQMTSNSTNSYKVTFRLLQKAPFIDIFEGKYYLYPIASNVTALCTEDKTFVKFSSMIKFSGPIPRFIQAGIKKLVNEIAVNELKKYAESQRMHDDFRIRPLPVFLTKRGKNRFFKREKLEFFKINLDFLKDYVLFVKRMKLLYEQLLLMKNT